MDTQKPLRTFVLAALFIVGSLLIIGGSYGVAFLDKVEKNYVPVTATIETIQERKEYRGGKRRVHHDVRVSFPANKTTYNAALNVYTPFMRVGDEIAILYNPGNPYEIHSTGIEKIIGWAFILAGVCFLLADWFVMRKLFRKKEAAER